MHEKLCINTVDVFLNGHLNSAIFAQQSDSIKEEKKNTQCVKRFWKAAALIETTSTLTINLTKKMIQI